MIQLNLKERLLLIVILPMVALFYFTYQSLADKQSQIEEANQLREFVVLTSALSELIHEVQRERGLSCGYLGSKGDRFVEQLPQQQRRTNAQMLLLIQLLRRIDPANFYPVIGGGAIDALLEHLDEIDFIRDQVQSIALSCPESLDWYSQLNQKMVKIVGSMSVAVSNPELLSRTIAHENLIRGKEFVGIERALASGVLARGYFITGIYKKLVEVATLQEHSRQLYFEFASQEQIHHYHEIMDDPVIKLLGEMRKQIFELREGAETGINPQQWFTDMSKKIDLLKQVEDQSIAEIISLAEQQLVQAESLYRWSLIWVLLTLLSTAWIAYQLSSRLARAFTSIETTVDRLAEEGDYSIRIPRVGGRGGVGRLISRLNTMLELQQHMVAESNAVIAAMARGDFSRRIAAEYKGDLQKLKTGINGAAADLGRYTYTLAHQRSELDSILSSMGDSLIVVDKRDHITKVNQQLLHLSGYTRSALLGQSIGLLLVENREVAEADGEDRIEFNELMQVILKRDPDEFYTLLQEAPVPLVMIDNDVEPDQEQIFLTSREFDKQLGADSPLQDTLLAELLSEEDMARIRNRLLTAEDGWGADGEPPYLWSCGGEEVESSINVLSDFCGKEARTLIILETEESIAWNLVELTQFGKLFSGRVRDSLELVCADGERVPVQVSGSVHREKRVVHGVVLSIHDMRALLSAESAERANVAKDEFLAAMSHELRTPLTSIIGNSEILSASNLSHEQMDLLGSVKSSAEQLLSLVNDILDLSKIQAGKFEIEITPFDLAALLDEVRGMFKVKGERSRVTFVVEQDIEPQVLIWGDQCRTKQILLNLLSNAFKFTESGEVVLRCWREQERLCFSVSDSGIGMSAEVLSRLFRPFEQADQSISRRFGGTGLGLHISHSLVEMMAGEMSVTSSEGDGSTFTLQLPYKESELPIQKSAEGEKESQLSAMFKGEVLVVEDTPELQLLEQRILGSMGVNVSLAEDGEKALSLVLEQGFDLILMDMQMPVMDGIEATERLRQLGVETPIIGVTANVMQKHQDLFYEAGADAFLGKPIDKSALHKVLSNYLERVENTEATGATETTEAPGHTVPFSSTPMELPRCDDDCGCHCGCHCGCQRVLAIDDDKRVLEMYRNTFSDSEKGRSIKHQLNELKEGLGGVSDSQQQGRALEVVVADQGADGIKQVRKALTEGRPFPVAFIDMRMPPGINGLETAKELRNLDQRIYIVFVTAHSDTSLEVINRELKYGVLYLRKPFDMDELQQIATMLVDSWKRSYFRDASFGSTGEPVAATGAGQGEVEVEVAQADTLAEFVDDEMRELVRESLQGYRVTIPEALSEENWADIRDAVHRIKGSMPAFGYEHLGRIAKKLQHQIDEGELESFRDGIGDLMAEIERALSII